MGYSDLKELLVDARNLAEGAHDLQLKAKLLDIQGLVYDLQDENRELRLKNEEMKRQEEISTSLVYKNNAYYDNVGKGPFCSACWDEKKVLTRFLNTHKYLSNSEIHGICPVCGNNVGTVFE